ncbi:MAG: DUF4326 domain-containing protein [Salinibacterium sp.]|nr:MAG: DUF4326 domain-containing protein [Salinibacterium sp.]
MKTRVVNIRASKYDVYVGRAGKGQKGTHGNPYLVSPSQPRGSTVNTLYRNHFKFKVENDKAYRAEVEKLVELKRKQNGELTLGCFCAEGTAVLTAGSPPYVCHGQVIAEYIDERCP